MARKTGTPSATKPLKWPKPIIEGRYVFENATQYPSEVRRRRETLIWKGSTVTRHVITHSEAAGKTRKLTGDSDRVPRSFTYSSREAAFAAVHKAFRLFRMSRMKLLEFAASP